jgi:hypothetical protein
VWGEFALCFVAVMVASARSFPLGKISVFTPGATEEKQHAEILPDVNVVGYAIC